MSNELFEFNVTDSSSIVVIKFLEEIMEVIGVSEPSFYVFVNLLWG